MNEAVTQSCNSRRRENTRGVPSIRYLLLSHKACRRSRITRLKPVFSVHFARHRAHDGRSYCERTYPAIMPQKDTTVRERVIGNNQSTFCPISNFSPPLSLSGKNAERVGVRWPRPPVSGTRNHLNSSKLLHSAYTWGAY